MMVMTMNNEPQEWLQLIDRGGLTSVNTTTCSYGARTAPAHPSRQMLYLEHIIASILENDNVLLLWSLVSADWEESSASALLEMIIRQWVKIRGFSYAWIEKKKETINFQPQETKQVYFFS